MSHPDGGPVAAPPSWMLSDAWLTRGIRGWGAYAIATILVALVTVIRSALHPIVANDVPLLPFIVAVLASSLVGGLRVGLYATIISAVVGEMLFVRPLGISVWSDASEAVRCGIFVASGLLVSAVIQALRAMRADAIRASDDKDAFIAMLAHEFRNPISAIHTALGVMQSRQTDERRTWARDMIERQANVMSRLVEDLLDAARIRRHTLDQLQPQPTAVVPIIESAVAGIEPLIAERTLQFHADIGEDAVVLADPIRLQQAIGNVLTNACRYTPPGGQVTISLSGGPTVTITVRDSGIGIRDADMERLFEPFERGSQSSGLGLGLFLARAFVHYSGGTLHATSPGEGAGSTFVIRLPAMRQDLYGDPAPARPQWQAAFDADPEGPRREAEG